MELVGQQRDESLVLDERARPAVVQDQRGGLRVRRSHVDDVERLAVDDRRELLVLVELRLLRTPVEPVAPVLGELLQVHQRDAAAEVGAIVPARHGDRPARACQPVAQVVEVGLRDVDAERCECVVLVHDIDVPSQCGRLASAIAGMIENMLETSARLLELLSLLQLKRDWTSSELAGRLEVSTRTVRADIGKLRSLGYPVDARPGVAGGYRLAAGTAMPPLLLDDDEAVAVAVGLGAVATRRLGVEETSLTALAKLEQVLPSRLRRRVEAVREATSVVPGAEPPLDLSVLGAVACRDPRPRTAPVRVHEARGQRRGAPHRTATAGELGTALVPARVGSRP